MNINKININQSEQTYNIASEIYDVTSHNNGVTFESLSALLSDENLSVLIPTAVRCGGMTIRFVQSSDNKYVQYRLMTSEWSFTESDWQGVDDVPTAGSDNLVKSVGVYEELSQLKHNIYDIPMIKGAYIPTDQGVGNICPLEQIAVELDDCTVIELKKGQSVDIVGVGGNRSRLWAILDKTTHEILDVAEANTSSAIDAMSSPLEKTITAEQDCIVVVNVYNENANPPYGNITNTPYSL